MLIRKSNLIEKEKELLENQVSRFQQLTKFFAIVFGGGFIVLITTAVPLTRTSMKKRLEGQAGQPFAYAARR